MGTNEIKLQEKIVINKYLVMYLEYDYDGWTFKSSLYTYPINLYIYKKGKIIDTSRIYDEKSITITSIFLYSGLEKVKHKKEKIRLIKKAARKLEMKHQLIN